MAKSTSTKHTFIARKALLEICSQIRSEANEIFYSENCFLIVADGFTAETSAKWLRTLGSNMGLIKDLQVGGGLVQ